jgi:3-oxoacyl-[acyl-carrier protein] reductase
MDLGLKGLRVLVTGGSNGIGRHCAEIFASEGANVSICARDSAGVTAAVESLKSRGVQVMGRGVDVADKHALKAWVNDSAATFGGIDIVVGNVSALAVGEDESDWEAGFQTDMMHCVRLVNASLPYLEKSKAASITLISSVSGREIDFTGYAYGAFKAAIVHYAQGLAFKHASKNIRANTVSPGNTYFDGGIWQSIEKNNPALFAQALAMNPTGRMAKPEEIARGVVFLASPASSFTTGTTLVIDGALTKGVQL